MAQEKECIIPEELYYDIERHVWIAKESDNIIKVGMTDPAQSLAGSLVKVSVKQIGKRIKKGRGVGIVESAKWVGPLPAPVDGEIMEINEKILDYPGVKIVNADPYGDGWIAKLKIDDFPASEFKTGKEGAREYKELLEKEGINCKKHV